MNNRIIKPLHWFVIIVLIVCFSVFVAGAIQPSKKRSEEPEKQIETIGELVKGIAIAGYSETGTIPTSDGHIGVDCWELRFPPPIQRQFEIQISIIKTGEWERSSKCSVPYYEIDSLLKGIDLISKATPKVTKLEHYQVAYTTEKGFTLTAFDSPNSTHPVICIRTGSMANETCYISIGQLQTFRDLIVQAKQKLDSIK